MKASKFTRVGALLALAFTCEHFLVCFAGQVVPVATVAGTEATTGTAPPAVAAPVAAPAPAAPAAPPVPIGVSMTGNTADSVTLTWFRSPGDAPKSYNVFTSAARDGNFNRIATVTERSATVNKLAPGSTAFYRVSAVNDIGESAQCHPVPAFTITPSPGAPFPVKIAKNMCLSLGATIVSTPAPSAGTLADLVDDSDGTSATLKGACEVKIKLNTDLPYKDADYLLLNFRTDSSGQGYPFNINWRSLKNFVITESDDSTDGKDGTWKDVLTATNTFLDGVVVIPNHSPRWLGVRNSGDLQLCRLQVFRAAPAGFRNDYWIFTGDSLVVQDMAGGSPNAHSVWFADLVHKQHSDRYPIVVSAAQGGEMLNNTFGRMRATLPVLSAPNGTPNATGTMVCWESGFNDIGLGGGLWMGTKFNQMLGQAKDLCATNGLVMVPVRIEFATGYMNKETLEPAKDTIFYNTLAANLAGVDTFTRTQAPYAYDPATQLPYADYWNTTRKSPLTMLVPKDGVHHTKEGSDAINHLWAQVADKMIYSRQ